MIKIIKTTEGLRAGNLVFVDSFVFPPNFMTVRPMLLDESFEKYINEDNVNIAYLNADEKYMNQLLSDNGNGKYIKGDFTAEKIYEPTSSFDDKLITWKIKYGDNESEISFIHELQNYYFDWVGFPLLDLESAQ